MKVTNPKTWLAFKISAICFGVVLTVYAVVSVLQNNGIYLYFGSFDSNEILKVVLGLLLLTFGSTAVLLLFSLKKAKVTVIVISIILGAAITLIGVYGTVVSLVFSTDYGYYTLTSPDGQHEIIIREENWLFGSWGDFYEKTSRFTMRKIGEYRTDDWPTVSQGTYDVEWYEDGFEFEYYYGNGINKTLVVEYID